jgi:threonine synthase
MRSFGEMFLTHLSCTACGLRHEWSTLQNLCTACQKPLFPIYDLTAAGRVLKREALQGGKVALALPRNAAVAPYVEPSR